MLDVRVGSEYASGITFTDHVSGVFTASSNIYDGTFRENS